MSPQDSDTITVIERGDGCYVWDVDGRRYLDGLSGLFTVNAGHGRVQLASAAGAQATDLGYFPIWGNAHPSAIELAARLADLAPGDLNRVFFTTGGSEAVDTAWKLARNYFKAVGEPMRTKIVSRHHSYHGTTFGATSSRVFQTCGTSSSHWCRVRAMHNPRTRTGARSARGPARCSARTISAA